MLLQEAFNKEIFPALKAKLGLKNSMLVPKLTKIVVNVTTGDVLVNPKLLDTIAVELGMITCQKPALTKSKKSIAQFKLRENVNIGAMVTLRGSRMYDFYNRLINVAVPRTRDFKGFSKRSFDGNGNYTLGITEQIIFPEILPEKVDKIRGMNITFCTNASSDDHARELLVALGFPFRS
jgi:large subunit ribosomal protein L5